MAGSFNQNIFLKLLTESDTSGLKAMFQPLDKIKSKAKQVQSQLKGLTEQQQAFQRASQASLQTGRSVFGQAPGRIGSTNKALQQAQQMSLGANEGMRRYASTTNHAGNRVMNFMGSQKRLNEQMQKGKSASESQASAFGEQFNKGMNLMFMGLALQQVFGGLMRSMFKATGASKAFGASLKAALLPFFAAITPMIVNVSTAIANLPRPIKMALGAMVLLLGIFGTFLFFGSQVFLLSLELSVGFLSLSGAILAAGAAFFALFAITFTIVRIFERFGPIVGTLAALIGGFLAAQIVKAALAYSSLGTIMAGTKAAALASAAATQVAAASQALLGTTSASTAAAMIAYGAAMTVATGAATLLNGALTVMNVLLSPITLTVLAIVLALGALTLAFIRVRRALKKNGFIKKLQKMLKPLGQAFKSVMKFIGGLLKGAIKFFKKLKEDPVKTIKKLNDKVRSIFSRIKAAIINKVMDLARKAKQFFKDAVSDILKEARKLKNKAVRRVKKLVSRIVTFFRKLPGRLARRGKRLVSTVIGFFGDIKEKGKNKVQDLIDFVTSLPSKIANGVTGIASTVADIGKDIVEGIVDGISGMGGVVTDAIGDLLPENFKKALNEAADFGGEALNAVTDVLTPNDFILTGDGKIIEPAADDTIVGFNGNGPIQPGGGGGDVTVNINDPVMKEDVDVQQVVDEVEDRVNRDARGRTGGL